MRLKEFNYKVGKIEKVELNSFEFVSLLIIVAFTVAWLM